MAEPGAPGSLRGLQIGATTVMAVLNVTDDSFSDGGSYNDTDRALAGCTRMLAAGAHVVDIGGQSTRPGAVDVSMAEEMQRVIPVVEAIRQHLGPDPVLSIDTFRAAVAEAALAAGADWINDVSGGEHDPAMLPLVARYRCPCVLMHRRGNSRTMNALAHYRDVVSEVEAEMLEQVRKALAAGVERSQLLLDPGLGFAKTTAHNLALLDQLPRLAHHGLPLLVGPSRKRFIGEILEQPDPLQRGWGTAAAVCKAIAGGAAVVRVHDVGPMLQVARMADVLWPQRPAGTCNDANS